MKVYVVILETGEYSDAYRGVEAVFGSQEKADTFVKDKQESNKRKMEADSHAHTVSMKWRKVNPRPILGDNYWAEYRSLTKDWDKRDAEISKKAFNECPGLKEEDKQPADQTYFQSIEEKYYEIEEYELG